MNGRTHEFPLGHTQSRRMNNASVDDLERQIDAVFLEIDTADRRIELIQIDIDHLRTDTQAILHDLKSATRKYR